MGRRGLVTAVVTALAALGTGALIARADYQGPDENASQAYGPLQAGQMYSAKLNQNATSPDDQDWYYYDVPAAGDKLHWTVSNTNAATDCPPYQCNVYATLEDSNGQQLGGSNSSAGTSGAGPGQTQTIDWTFQSPGKYYIAFIGDGAPIGYRFSFSVSVPSGSGTTKLVLHANQSGRAVDFTLTIPTGGGRLDALLYVRNGGTNSLAGSLHRSHVGAGKAHFAITLGKASWALLGKRHRLPATLRVALTPAGGAKLHASQTLVLQRR
jgi:hypothetical protein